MSFARHMYVLNTTEDSETGAASDVTGPTGPQGPQGNAGGLDLYFNYSDISSIADFKVLSSKFKILILEAYFLRTSLFNS